MLKVKRGCRFAALLLSMCTVTGLCSAAVPPVKCLHPEVKTAIWAEAENMRFAVERRCGDCDFVELEYVAAKLAVADFVGTDDGLPHGPVIENLCDPDVHVSARYGTSEYGLTETSPPEFSDAGEYEVFYEITYTYEGASFTESGSARVILRQENTGEGPCACGCTVSNCGCSVRSCDGSCCDERGCGERHFMIWIGSRPASCTTSGYSRYYCAYCGRIERASFEAPLGHEYINTTVREAGCYAGGLEISVCAVCGHAESRTTPALPHSYIEHTEVPSCTEGGYTEYTCVVCGYKRRDGLTPPSGHTSGGWIVDKEPSYGAEGMRHRECVVCGEVTEREVIDPLPWPEPERESGGRNTEVHNAFAEGYEDGTFRPNRPITRAEAAEMIARLLGETTDGEAREAVRFRDVADGAWYADSVHLLAAGGIIEGRGGGLFSPAEPMTRAELAAIMVKFCVAEDMEFRDGYVRFTDVGSGHWAAGYASICVRNGWMDAFQDGSFRPDAPVTRAEAVQAVCLMLGRADIDTKAAQLRKFSDIGPEDPAYWAVAEAANTHRVMR